MKKDKLNLKYISDSRAFLLGIATISILFFHSSFNVNGVNKYGAVGKVLYEVLFFLKDHGNLGVDMFLFLSAIGLYYSMSKNENVKDFYKRRAIRILPSLLIVELLWFAIMPTMGVNNYILDVLGISFITNGNRTIWYFVLIIFLYLIYPLLYKLQKKYDSKVFIIMIPIIIIINSLLSIISPTFFTNTEIALRRIPIFLIGCWLANKVKDGYKLNKKHIILSIIAIIIFIIIQEINYHIEIPNFERISRYTFCLPAIGIIVLLSNLYHNIKTKKYIEWIGSYSLEFYLLFEKFLILCIPLFKVKDDFNLCYNIAVFILTAIMCIALKKIVKVVLSRET